MDNMDTIPIRIIINKDNNKDNKDKDNSYSSKIDIYIRTCFMLENLKK